MRKNIIKILSLTLVFNLLFMVVYANNTADEYMPELRFSSLGTFKIVQFADIQDGPLIDSRTINLMNKILDFEKPDLVVLTGDNIDGRCKSKEDVKKAIDNIASPMEKRNIPWAIVFGNHDEEQYKVDKRGMMKIYMSYPNNISSPGPENIAGVGNYNILIKGSVNESPAFNLYLLDSGSYAPENIGGYDWIKASQIKWYKKTSSSLEKKYKKLIPSLMFFHIPLPEWKELWNSGKAIGNRYEEEHPPKFNSGFFKEVVKRGDVKGIFVGHDHVNDYVGELSGVKLGYSRSAGYGTYGREGFARGGRVFLIKENEPEKITTWMRVETDF